MQKIMILKTSVDETVQRLIEEMHGVEIYCLIQHSQVERFKTIYPNIIYIDIRKEIFYDLDEDIFENIKGIIFDELYITFTGLIGHNYGNVMEIAKKIRWKKGFFYNCNGNKTEIPVLSKMQDFFLGLYIDICKIIY